MIFFLRSITNGLAPLTLLGAVLAYWHPPLFLIFKDYFLWLFAATMFSLGVVLEPEELTKRLKHPRSISLGLLSQYTVMPLLGFTVAWLAELPAELALGLIIVGCAPGAMASNVIVYLAGGAVAYSVALTAVATCLSPLATPVLVKWLGGVYLPIPFWPMMQTIILTVLLPLLLGLLMTRYTPVNRTLAKQIAPAVAAIAIIIICSYAVSANASRIATVGPRLFVWVVVVNACGYVCGWYLARLYGFDLRHRLALSIEIGMQNAGLGVALALKHFSPEVALPGALFAVWCILTAAGASTFIRRSVAKHSAN